MLDPGRIINRSDRVTVNRDHAILTVSVNGTPVGTVTNTGLWTVACLSDGTRVQCQPTRTHNERELVAAIVTAHQQPLKAPPVPSRRRRHRVERFVLDWPEPATSDPAPVRRDPVPVVNDGMTILWPEAG